MNTDTHPHDPYSIHDIQQLFTLFNGGEFLSAFMRDHKKMLTDMQDHMEEYSHKNAKGGFTISVSYELNRVGDLTMTANADFKAPKKPSSSAGAYVDADGQMSLMSPMMKRMHGGVRDVTPHDPETGEVHQA
ncbi:hypothetical protein [Pseudooceanicola sp. MF1-13]|uniref:hypothetical protein n=1 Tax=Pseudooceanicola sp. MF1-13 TaxID=3379095 RepID=UPI003892A641